METKQKRMLVFLVLVFSVLFVVTIVSIRPFSIPPEPDPIPPLPDPPSPVKITISSTPTLQAISPDHDPDGSIHLKWDMITEAKAYQVYMSMDGTSWNLIKTTGAIAYIHHGLADGVYKFKVRGYNLEGYTDMSNVRSVTVAIPVVPEAPVLNDIAHPNSNGEIYLEWNSVVGAESYQIQMSIDSGSFSPIITTTGITYTHSVSTNGNYKFKVRAYNLVGYSWYSDIKSVIVSIPNIPVAPTLTNLTSEFIGETVGIQLTWNDVDCDSYNVYRSFNDGDYILIKANLFSTTYYEVLTETGLYSYRITAENIYGESELSNLSSITITEDGGVAQPTDYTALYILLGILVVLIVPIAIILVKRKKR